jgi:hypothetical protein
MDEPKALIQSLESEIVVLEHQLREEPPLHAEVCERLELTQQIARLDGQLQRLHAQADAFPAPQPA